MLGQRSPQRGLFDGDSLFLNDIPEDSFYVFLATHRDRLFNDEDFAALYSPDFGRPSVPPSLLGVALLLQCYDKTSDQEACERANFDVRWCCAMGVQLISAPFAKSTLQMFRAKLILNDKVGLIFQKSLEFATESGFLKGRKVKVAVDTTPIFGAAAVKDTYNLLADGIRRVIYELVSRHLPSAEGWASGNGFSRYFGSSIKGQADVDWDDEASQREFLWGIVEDALDLLYLVDTLPSSEQHGGLMAAAAVLRDLIGQDVEYDDYGPRIRRGVAKDRIVSAQDPDMRHGRKSAHQRFDGYKGAIAVDPESGIIMAVDVVPAGTHDGDTGLPLTEAVEQNTGCEVEETIGDAAYGDATTREEFAQAGRKIVAKVPTAKRSGQIAKEEFEVDLEAGTCTCPAGQVTSDVRPAGTRTNRRGEVVTLTAFQFPAEACGACPLQSSCTSSPNGRSIQIHSREMEIRQAREFQRSPEFKPYKQARQQAEHGIARLARLGIKKAKYRGISKIRFQILIASAVANLTLAVAAGYPNGPGTGATTGALLEIGLYIASVAILAIYVSMRSCGSGVAVPLRYSRPLRMVASSRRWKAPFRLDF